MSLQTCDLIGQLTRSRFVHLTKLASSSTKSTPRANLVKPGACGHRRRSAERPDPHQQQRREQQQRESAKWNRRAAWIVIPAALPSRPMPGKKHGWSEVSQPVGFEASLLRATYKIMLAAACAAV